MLARRLAAFILAKRRLHLYRDRLNVVKRLPYFQRGACVADATAALWAVGVFAHTKSQMHSCLQNERTCNLERGALHHDTPRTCYRAPGCRRHVVANTSFIHIGSCNADNAIIAAVTTTVNDGEHLGKSLTFNKILKPRSTYPASNRLAKESKRKAKTECKIKDRSWRHRSKLQVAHGSQCYNATVVIAASTATTSR